MENSTNSTAEEPMSPLIERLFLSDQIINYFGIVLIMMGMGGATEPSEIKKSFRRPWGILICWLSQFGLMPLVAFGLAHAIDLQPEYAIGLIIQCSSPGGSMSNVFSFMSKGNVSLSICLTTCSTVIAIGAMPLSLFLYGSTWSGSAQVTIPYVTIVITLILVLVPAAIGLFLKYRLPKHILRITKVCALVGILCLLVGIVIRAYINPSVFTELSWEVWLLVTVLPVLAGFIGFLAASVIRLPCSSRRTICIETSGQNVALSIAVINSSFPSGNQRATMQVISSLYGPIMAAEILIAIFIFRAFYTRGYCGACDYGDVESEREMVLRAADEDGEAGKKTAEGNSKVTSLSLKRCVPSDTAQLATASNGDPKTDEKGTNVEYHCTNLGFQDDDKCEDKGVNTEERYFM